VEEETKLPREKRKNWPIRKLRAPFPFLSGCSTTIYTQRASTPKHRHIGTFKKPGCHMKKPYSSQECIALGLDVRAQTAWTLTGNPFRTPDNSIRPLAPPFTPPGHDQPWRPSAPAFYVSWPPCLRPERRHFRRDPPPLLPFPFPPACRAFRRALGSPSAHSHSHQTHCSRCRCCCRSAVAAGSSSKFLTFDVPVPVPGRAPYPPCTLV